MSKKPRTYLAEDGTELILRPVSPMAIQQIQRTWRKIRPKPPKIDVLIPGTADKTRQEVNLQDPVFIQEIEDWEADMNSDIMKYAFTVGVRNQPDDEFSLEHMELFPDATDRDIKFMWVSSKALSEQANQDLLNSILGQNMVIPEGLNQSADNFRSDGERRSDMGLDVQGETNSIDTVQHHDGGAASQSLVRDIPGGVQPSPRNPDVDGR